MIYKMTLKDSADEMTFDLLEVPIVDKDIEGAVDNVTLDGNQYTDYLWLKKQFIQKWSILCDDEYTRLRGFYTRQFENADVPSYRLYYGDDIIRNSTLSGERIELSISGVADGTMSLTQMDGNIEQTTYTGKNLLQAKMPTTTINGITCTNNGDGSYTLNGTATAGADFRINQSTAHGQDNLQNYDGTYTLSCDELQNDMQLIIMQNGTWSQILRMRNSNTPATATFTKNDCFIYVYVAQGKTLNNLRIHPMLEKSATATAYEPYVGGIPAPNPSYPQPIETVTGRQTVTVTGKNLFNPTATPWGSKVAYNGSGTQVWWDGYYGIIKYQPVQPNTQYTFSNSTGKPIHYGIVFYDANKAKLSNISDDTTTFTTPANCAYIRFAIQNDTAPTWAQLELGNQATAYEPYRAQEYEINLGKNLLKLPTTPYTAQGLTTTPNADGSFTYTGTTTGEWANLINTFNNPIPAGTYMFSKQTNHYYTLRFDHADGTNTRISISTAQSGEVTLSKDATGYQFWVWGLTANTKYTVTERLQLERGYRATSFAPYFTPIELCKIGTYQDRIYKENGKWWLYKEVGKAVLNGSETWTGWQQSGGFYRANTILDGSYVFTDDARHPTRVRSSHFTSSTTNNYGIVFQYRAETLFYPQAGITSLADFKTWLGTALPSVYYALATPTTTEITNEALVAELEALQDEAISVGLHNIYTDTPNALPTLTFDLTEYLSKSTTIIPETAVRLTLADGGVINACGCRKDVQLTMRETIE